MKSLIRNIVFYSISLFLLTLLLDGVTIRGGIPTILLGGFVLTLLFMFIKPVLSIITFPINIITLGFFSWIVNVFLLYLLTVFVPSIKIQAFAYDGYRFAGFVVPSIEINTFFAFLIAALMVYTVTTLLAWLTR